MCVTEAYCVLTTEHLRRAGNAVAGPEAAGRIEAVDFSNIRQLPTGLEQGGTDSAPA
jgi:hypothetical protein